MCYLGHTVLMSQVITVCLFSHRLIKVDTHYKSTHNLTTHIKPLGGNFGHPGVQTEGRPLFFGLVLAQMVLLQSVPHSMQKIPPHSSQSSSKQWASLTNCCRKITKVNLFWILQCLKMPRSRFREIKSFTQVNVFIYTVCMHLHLCVNVNLVCNCCVVDTVCDLGLWLIWSIHRLV